MSKFIQHMLARHVSDLIGPSSGAFCTSCIRRLWYVVIRVLLDTSSRYGWGEILWEDLREGDHLEEPGIDGKIIVKWFFKKWDGCAMDGSGSVYGQVAGACQCGNERLGSTKHGDFLD